MGNRAGRSVFLPYCGTRQWIYLLTISLLQKTSILLAK